MNGLGINSPKTDLHPAQHKRSDPISYERLVAGNSRRNHSRMTQGNQPDPILLQPDQFPQSDERVLQECDSASLGCGRDSGKLDIVRFDMSNEGHEPMG